MKRILGLDLGTNSIGWALIEINHEKGIVKILGLGSRILPMDAGEIGDFEASGKIKSAAAARTEKRGPRRLNERYLLRRDRLHLVLNLLDALPQHYKLEIDFTNKKGEKCGQFKTNKQPKLAYLPKSDAKKAEFLFMDSYEEMLKDIDNPSINNKKGGRIPYDWTLYYLRQKALSKKITLEELAWVLLSYNQKRGYEKLDVEDKSTKDNEIIEELDLAVKAVNPKIDKEGHDIFEIQLEGNDSFIYSEDSRKQISFKGDIKEVLKISQIDETGEIDKKKTKFTITDIYELEIESVKYEKTDKATPHKYSFHFTNGWMHSTEKKKYTSQFNKLKGKTFDYIVTSSFDYQGNFEKRSFKTPDYNSDTSKDWTLLKKKTEKEALKFNSDHGYKDEEGNTKNYISPKIYSILKEDAKTGKRTKIIGGMFQVVERDFYREELKQIIATQRECHDSLKDAELFERCVKTLYPKNESHAKNLLNNKDTIEHLLVEDILLYQRPLKTKKSEIADCKYEIHYWKKLHDKKTEKPIEIVNKETGEITISKEAVYHKAVSASHPYFQEFRIWDKLHNLKLIQMERETDGKLSTNVDVTREYFDMEAYQALFSKMNNQKSLNQKQFLSFCKSTFKIKDIENYVWNFPEDEELKGNETRVSFATRFKRCGFDGYADFLTQEKEIELWHYLYSVNYKERKENDSKSIQTFFNRFLNGSGVSDEIKGKIIEDFTNYPKFASRYCAYSEKALKKLLPFLRMGENRFTGKFDLSAYQADLENINYDKSKILSLFIAKGKEAEDKKQSLYEALWKHSINKRIDEILDRLKKIDFEADKIDYTVAVTNESNPKSGTLPYPKGLFNAFREFKEAANFTSLDLTKASYLVYGRHSELAQIKQWKSPDDIRKQLHQELKQHSLNNPVAEKVIREMMQVVADIWDYYGSGVEKFFSEIHVEVGRELKKSVKEKDADTTRQKGNRAQNKRIRQVLEEFLSNSTYNANPKNSDHFERLKIVEEGAEHRKNIDKEFFKDKSYSKKDIEDILKKQSISKADFEKYKLWIEQGYLSPYSGQMIKITELFDGNKYNIDHIFPQASITNDSLSNKVVVEVALNQLKGDKTARDFIQAQGGQPYLGIPVCSEKKYVSIVTSQFSGNKKHILLSKEIPKGFTNSQLNNARHIARKAMELLSHLVREDGEIEFLSKNVLPVTGAVTGKLKEAWKLDEVWKELVAPRFIRMNELTQSNLFGQERVSKSGHTYFDCNLDDSIREKDESYNIKRIDHRHHALDALVVALCTRDHVNYISNINAGARSADFGKQRKIEKYRQTLKRKLMFSKKEDGKDDKDWYYMLPGETRQQGAEKFTRDTVKTKSYFYKDFDAKGDYKEMILSALQHTVATFKQNMRVINKTVNQYNNTPNKKEFTKQEGKYNWAIRRSLGKGTYYARIDIGKRENKQLLKNIDFFFKYPDAIVDTELRGKIESIINETKTIEKFEQRLKDQFKNKTVKCIAYQAASRYNSELNTSFNRDKIKNQVADKGIQRILTRQLDEFDTVELPFEEALGYYEAVLEKHEFGAIVNDSETEFDSFDDFASYLKAHEYKYKKVDYSKLNVFIEQVSGRDFRNEEQFKDKIIEHPEIAFTPEEVVKMNTPENMRKLNMNEKGEEKNHAPIRKVRTYTGFGNEKRVSNNENTNKYRQFVKVDKGTNFYIAIYEIGDKSKINKKNPLRLFKEINLFDLIDFQKSTSTNALPIEEQIYSEDGEKYQFCFTLTQNDTVKVNDRGNELIYAFNRFSGSNIYFRPINHASEIDKCEVDLKPINPKTGKNPGSQTNETASLNGEQIKNICWKLQADRLGNIRPISGQ